MVEIFFLKFGWRGKGGIEESRVVLAWSSYSSILFRIGFLLSIWVNLHIYNQIMHFHKILILNSHSITIQIYDHIPNLKGISTNIYHATPKEHEILDFNKYYQKIFRYNQINNFH